MCIIFHEKYDSQYLYDEYMKKTFIIYHEQPQFDKYAGWTWNSWKPDVYLLYHEYFRVYDDLFDIIQSSHQYNNITLNFILNKPNENVSQGEATEILDNKIQKKNGLLTRNQQSILFIERKGFFS